MREATGKLSIIITIALSVVLASCGGAGNPLSDAELVGSYTDVFGNSTGIVNRVNSPSEMIVGDVIAYELDEGEETIDFGGTTPDAQFLLITGTRNITTGTDVLANSTFPPTSDKSFMLPMAGTDYPGDVEDDTSSNDVDEWLRSKERDLAFTETVPEYGASPATGKSLSVGSERSFKVLTEILTSVQEYTVVDARAECLGSEANFFVDSRVSEQVLSGADVAEVCDEFDSVAREVMNLLGEISDVNGDGRLTVLITPQVNMLRRTSGTFVVGYFYAGDLYSESSSNPASNKQEIIYLAAPDPSGVYGTSFSLDFFLDVLLPSVLPHELQHAISFNQHVFENGGEPEVPWLNEGMSHFIEDYVGQGLMNQSRYTRFLSKTARTRLVHSNAPSLEERGASYLFIRYLYEQAADGDAFIRSLMDTNRTGLDNVQNAFDGEDPNFNQFSEFMAQWFVALAMTDAGIYGNRRFSYESPEINASTGNIQGVNIGESSVRGTNRSNGINYVEFGAANRSSLVPTSASFFSLDEVPNEMTLTTGDESAFAILIRSE